VTLRGFDAPDEYLAKPDISPSRAEQATQNPTHASEPDVLAAFVACLTAEQRARLAELLNPANRA